MPRTFAQSFNTTERHQCDVIDPKFVAEIKTQVENLIDTGLAQIPDVPGPLDDMAKAAAKASALNTLGVHLAIIVGSTPTPWLQTSIEGSCETLPATTINLVNSGVDGITSFKFAVANIPVVNGIAVAGTLRVQVSAGRYTYPHHCNDYPAYQAWERERDRILNDRQRYRQAHEKWLRDMEAYRQLLKERGSAFDENGVPYPTPKWPEDVRYPTEKIPPQPPYGTYKVRQFHVLWTYQVDVTLAVVTLTYQGTLSDDIYSVQTRCCAPE